MSVSHNIACIVLGAGRSTRMGTSNKLLADIGGKAMVRHVVEAALASRARPVLVVLGHQAQEVRTALSGLHVTVIDNPDYAAGLSTSLKAGIRALPRECQGVLVLLGDMPQITAAHLDCLIAAFIDRGGKAIIVPTGDGRRGNPVLWPAGCFPELLQLAGDAGARRLLTTHADAVHEVDLGTEAIFADVDTPEELMRLRGTRKPI